ncbi:hypothetical protein OPS25_00780 [Alteromonas ponticola]|uniref:Uncharacterized protein n=1 Tax=Alteromonas aquimaris TaxID=2998417 RepID=A0ABT3P2P8_9ALTE|nr:hypothetical protein [Alteromonas aquimaris]MCW8107036.1 hypothetical protein [Alteromonas aquimaris]
MGEINLDGRTIDVNAQYTGKSLDEINALRDEIRLQKAAITDSTAPADIEEYKRLDKLHRELSEAEGLLLAEALADTYPNAQVITPTWGDGSSNINLDRVVQYQVNDEIRWLAIEAKGGGSGLGKRLTVDKQHYAQQGSQQNWDSLYKDMVSKRDSMEQRGIQVPAQMDSLISAMKQNSFEYVVVSKAIYDQAGRFAGFTKSVFPSKTPPPGS